MIRHLADFVLVWAGGNGDDLGKSPWMARIGNSVYRDICPNDPLCEQAGLLRAVIDTAVYVCMTARHPTRVEEADLLV